jgi:hypothetical protein
MNAETGHAGPFHHSSFIVHHFGPLHFPAAIAPAGCFCYA